MGSTIADYDGDGRLDIFKTNFSDDTLHPVAQRRCRRLHGCHYSRGSRSGDQVPGLGNDVLRFRQRRLARHHRGNGHVYPEVDKFNLGSNYEEPRLLYHNNGNGTFTNISATSGAAITTAAFFAWSGGCGSLERRPACP